MKIEIFETIQNENIDMARFVVDGINLELANAFRRLILSEVPCMAIDEVIFLENDSPLYDEIIAHRLGLIPLKTNLDAFKLPQDCNCGGAGCALCQVEFTCNVKAELNNTIISSKDILSSEPGTVPVKDDIIIAKLQKNSSLLFEAYARLGIGKDHAKWQPVSAIGFGYYPDVKIDSSKCKNCGDKCIAARRCPVNVIAYSDDALSASLIDGYWKDCTLCESCAKYCPENAVTIGQIENKFVFTIEGTGALPIKTILLKACDIMIDKIHEFKVNIKDKELFPVK